MTTLQPYFRRKVRLVILNVLAKIIPSKIARVRANQKTLRALTRQYGDLQPYVDWKSLSVGGLENESKQVFGMVVQFIRNIDVPIDLMLLAGESSSAKPIYSSITGISPNNITTAGLHEDADRKWNFEDYPPRLSKFDCIVSHAVLEHLIDPYRHVSDLVSLLEPRGHLVVFTVAPGFPYHRHPIDCFRFFPDWFEAVAQRLDLEVCDRFFGDERVVYRFRNN